MDKTYLGVTTQLMKELEEKGVDVGVVIGVNIDRGMVEIINGPWWKVAKARPGGFLLAGFLHGKPEFGRLGPVKIPRTWTLLESPRPIAPGGSRGAHALPVWAAMAYVMVSPSNIGEYNLNRA